MTRHLASQVGRLLALVVISTLSLDAQTVRQVQPAEPGETGEPGEPVHGITVSTHTSNRGWDTEELGATFGDIAAVGANWVAIHPYARISDDGEVRFRPFLEDAPPGYLRRPIDEAHRLGLDILIKPHLAYWGSSFDWRGEIEFDSEQKWRRFFSSYQAWIEALARATTDANGFVIGTELDRTVHRREWKQIIARFRELSGVPLTYAANWTDYQRVPFWRSLDVVGIQAYFPIAGENPSEQELEQGWQIRMDELRAYSGKVGKKIVFTELGYSRSHRAALEPWKTGVASIEGELLQARCLSAALRAMQAEPEVLGAFLWKWFPRPRSVGRDFEMAAPAIQKVIRDHWFPDARVESSASVGAATTASIRVRP